MKAKWPIIFLTVTLAACGGNNVAENDDFYPKNGNSVNKNEQADIYNDIADDQFGFVRQVKSPVPADPNDAKPIKWMDREQAAHNISQLLVVLPNVQDASVIVTDEEVLVAYNTDADDEKARFETADQVKKSVMGAVPRWYHVYVTDDPKLRQDVENIGSMTTQSPNKDRTVKIVVDRMLERSPQGRALNEGENANGEENGEENNHLDKTKYKQQYDRDHQNK
ncbi:YhcN/YlaJ family sporulation lipoprotein [Lederbergia sp. NSJ-179]|uniref:YhcN/YlaJ family sporulation lipoprotein n=1 Tax=Lederbergia sp. NSJ-179 TaxID=2931402 RepID=UPI001FCF9AF2|nr:YhcN/YlaJ family sporulation lipoprotein [Lederbergia sp. NSJ-179]MCJ7840316.1 YhcN/YlaJ family sporulation lipoprotein [Lederbergia sp. NSJ-179]